MSAPASSGSLSARAGSEAAAPARPLRAVALVALAGLIATVANCLVGLVAVAAGASPAVPAMTPAAIVPFSVIGVALATVGWYLVVRLARRPASVLRVLVPVLTVLSFAPDVLLAMGGAGVTEIVAVVLMHLVAVAVVVPALVVALPPRDRR